MTTIADAGTCWLLMLRSHYACDLSMHVISLVCDWLALLHTQVTPQYRPLAEYAALYGTGGDVNTALLDAGLLNVTQVQK
jgi:hypothetical protein